MTEEKRSCETCVFMDRQRPDSAAVLPMMVCRRHPPHALALPTPQGVVNVTTFPVVSAESWCYEWTKQTLNIAFS